MVRVKSFMRLDKPWYGKQRKDQVKMAKGLQALLLALYSGNIKREKALLDSYNMRYKELDNIRHKTSDAERIAAENDSRAAAPHDFKSYRRSIESQTT